MSGVGGSGFGEGGRRGSGHACLFPRRAVAMELSADYLREKLRQDLEAEHVVSAGTGTRATGKGSSASAHRPGLLPARRWRTRL